jgi:hypothetical protein
MKTISLSNQPGKSDHNDCISENAFFSKSNSKSIGYSGLSKQKKQVVGLLFCL